ncbi:hypothetical protein [Vreelandella piezotolerans]|uniref:hypothetical protein n=1 Tax=Vreelandella piezotolerans TaxID=2609667 RepID=UPI0037A4A343
MPLSNVERQVLELICDQHRQTRRGARAAIVHIGMNAKSGQQKARIVEVLHGLKKRGLLVMGPDAWVPTSEGEAALGEEVPVAAPKVEEQPKHCDECKAVLTPDEVEFLEGSCSACETKAFQEAEAQEFSATVERVGTPLPDDLLNRCAVMNATLLAQAKQAHEAGEPEAWRDLHWLMETAQQLVALGGAE